MALIHASSVALDAVGVLITGSSGAGKSSLCIELLSRGGLLVADDQVQLTCRDDGLYAAAPPELDGLIELYGIGIVPCPNVACSPVKLAFEVQLERAMQPIERMPPPQEVSYMAKTLPKWRFDGENISLVAAKITLLAKIFQQYGELRLVEIAKLALND